MKGSKSTRTCSGPAGEGRPAEGRTGDDGPACAESVASHADAAQSGSSPVATPSRGNSAPTTLAATHAALLRLAAGHGTVKLAVSAWDYQDHDPPTSQIDWSASVFAHGSSEIILAHVYAVATPALLLASVAAQLAAHAAAQSADVQALGEMPEVQS